MTVSREDMIKSLKARAVPVLRDLGFRGSFPHFYRDRDGHVDLVSFQFGTSGGRFVAELAFVSPDRKELTVSHLDTPPSKLRAYFTFRRLRVGGKMSGNCWYVYADPMVEYGETCHTPDLLAMQVSTALRIEGVNWWNDMQVGAVGV